MSSPVRPDPGRLAARLTARAADLLRPDDAARAVEHPGPVTWRQPVHVVYLPAHLLTADPVGEWGAAALEALRAHMDDATARDLVAVAGGDPDDAATVRDLVAAKLDAEPVEDLRVDFEDGFIHPGVEPADSDADEDARVDAAVALFAGGAPAPFAGIRFRSMEPRDRDRGIRTLTRFVAGLHAAGAVPPGRALRLTLPKVTSAAQVEAAVGALEGLEGALGLEPGRLGLEIQVETPQAVLAPDGTCPLPAMITAGGGRVLALHYGTYDHTASMGVSAADQAMDHPVADHAIGMMQAAAAGRGVEVSHGSTALTPAGPRADVHRVWGIHARLVGRHLSRGVPQGWDLHPGHLPSRFTAVYAWFRARLPDALARLDAHLAGRAGAIADEPATARAMAGMILRAVHCGALPEGEARRALGLGRGELTTLTRTGRLP